MFEDKTESTRQHGGQTSRRRFLQVTAGAAAMAPIAARVGLGAPQASPHRILAWVGTFSNVKAPDVRTGCGQGILLFDMNPTTGALTQREIYANSNNPSWLVIDPSGKHLYTVDEVASYEGGPAGAVTGYSIDHATGQLTMINTVSSEGPGPTHMSIHPSGKYAFVANYIGGSVAVLPIDADGKLGAATDVFHDKGTIGPNHATSGPPGSFTYNGHYQGTPHAHVVEPDKSGKFVLCADAALDRILVWKFDVEKGTLTPNDPDGVSLPPGDGPRHFAFSPKGNYLYSLQEESSTIVTYAYGDGKLTEKQSLSSLPKGFKGTSLASGIVASADGKFVYAANRMHNTIAWFPVGADGKLSWGGEEWTRGDFPRAFNIDPTGNFLYSCNQRGDNLTTFRINRATGALSFTGAYTPVGTPSHIVFQG